MSYTLSHSKDDASSPGATESEANVPQNVRNIFDETGEWALSSFDHRHQFIASGVYRVAVLHEPPRCHAKTWPLGGSRLEFRWEIFNLLNRANFDLPNRTFGDPNFGRIFRAKARERCSSGCAWPFRNARSCPLNDPFAIRAFSRRLWRTTSKYAVPFWLRQLRAQEFLHTPRLALSRL